MQTRRRWWVISLLVLLAAALVAGTWVVALNFQSPAQRQAAAEPPPAQPVVVEVTRGSLTNRKTMMAEATLDDPRSETIPMGEGTSVITAAGVSVGESLNAGAVITWVNDRPIFALTGRFPFFRDIGEGDSGDDVLMFQQVLAALGYDIDPDGGFGTYTAWCVRDLYKQVGASAPVREVKAATPKPTEGTSDKSVDKSDSPAAAASTNEEVMMPKSEVVVLPSLPMKVAEVPAVGTVLNSDNAKLSLSGQGVILAGKVPGATAVQLSGDIQGTAQVRDQIIPLKVSAVKSAEETADPAAPPGESGDPSQSTVLFAPTQGTFPSDWVGKTDVLVSLDMTPPLEGVLLVPQRAIAADAAGKETILLQQADGSFTQKSVTVQGCFGGMCAIAEGDGIAEGAMLRVDR